MNDSQSEFTLDDELLERIDKWRTVQHVPLGRAAAVAELVRTGLRDPDDVLLSKGDKLILATLCSISRKIDAKGIIDPDFLEEAIRGGHSWAIEWEHPSLLHGHSNSQSVADFVVRVLSMWKRIEESFAHLGDAEKDEVRQKAGLSGDPQFPGWNGYDEANYKSTARFMTDRMELFPMFEGRSALESSVPVVRRYKAMLKLLEGLGPEAGDRRLNADELVRLLVSS